jgi:hypothetical protein
LTALWFRKSKRDQRSLFVQPKLAELSGYPAEWNALAVSEVARTGEFTMAWQGTVHTPVIDLAAGDYELVVEHRGTPLAGQYPIANVQVVGGPDGALKMLDERFTSEGTARVYRSRPFHVQDKTAARISIAFLNDLGNGIEDRNLFLRGVYVLRGGSR